MPTYSQCGQDGFVLSRFDEPGYFVEAGAMDGLVCSNTKLLEERGWQGICVEPYEPDFMKLVKNRECQVDKRALTTVTGEKRQLDICQTKYMQGTLRGFQRHLPYADRHLIARQQVSTITLQDLLAEHNAPREIQYLSLDVEGHELCILQAFNFEYMFHIITVECQTMSRSEIQRRRAIKRLLQQYDYRRFGALGPDDIYFHKSVARQLKGR